MSSLADRLNKGMGRRDALRLGHEALRNSTFIKELDQLSASPDFTLAGKSSWILALLTEEHPEALVSFASSWIQRLRQHIVRENVKREYLRCLLVMPWSDEVAGELIDCCMELLQHGEHDTGVKYNALRILARASKQWPELRPEISELARRHMHSDSVGIRSLARKMG
jgi:hypothetical protein